VCNARGRDTLPASVCLMPETCRSTGCMRVSPNSLLSTYHDTFPLDQSFNNVSALLLYHSLSLCLPARLPAKTKAVMLMYWYNNSNSRNTLAEKSQMSVKYFLLPATLPLATNQRRRNHTTWGRCSRLLRAEGAGVKKLEKSW